VLGQGWGAHFVLIGVRGEEKNHAIGNHRAQIYHHPPELILPSPKSPKTSSSARITRAGAVDRGSGSRHGRP
jgi:hypothetical protein